MNERIKELAEQAFMVCLKGADEKHLEQLERFAELVRQDEREACAKLCEEQLTEPKLVGWNGFEYYMTQCAARIRGRTE
jgi:hypothetical protein